MSGFQSVINQQQAPGVEGDFASANPKASLLAGEGALVAGANGVVVGRFAWVSNGVVNNTGTGAPAGFVHREGQASVTTWLCESSMTIQPGVQMTLMTAGDYWVKTAGAATVGQKIFAKLSDGTITAGDAGASISDYVETKFVVGSAGEAGELIQMGTWS
ncbi:hypothetical protein ECP030481610_1105 [Escherichia coli P0304816.10]|uniref:structural cement protein Gp24 n=1 Tax=Escherichia coli TaxID=562 RepID=UPI0002CA4067|nr:hypothetical protein [Escherichia coli]ENF25979.1 hypothetical protein ECP030481610_1105 [Escherichia coli P0304816.10]